MADFHLEFHNYTPPTYTRWKLKLNFFDVCHLTYAGQLAQLDKWSLQYGRRELLPASFSECRLLDHQSYFWDQWSKYCKSSCEWNINRRRFDRQRGEMLTRTGPTKVRVFRKLPETTEQRAERAEVFGKTKQERLWQKDGDKSRMSGVTRGVEQHKTRMSRVTRGVEQHKAREVEAIETSLQRAERVEVLSKTKQERLWQKDGDKSRMSRVTRGVVQHKARKLRQSRQVNNEQSDSKCWANLTQERLIRRQVYNEQRDSRCWAKQSKKDWDGNKSTTSRATGSVEQNKTRFQIDTETISLSTLW